MRNITIKRMQQSIFKYYNENAKTSHYRVRKSVGGKEFSKLFPKIAQARTFLKNLNAYLSTAKKPSWDKMSKLSCE